MTANLKAKMISSYLNAVFNGGISVSVSNYGLSRFDYSCDMIF